ncbi:ABC transporter substrate-binding protein [Acidimicrobiia bacterium EGI L10123]|uniref:ABC transporter substrate-binding protein n=1 Tax=Salinilacustrithrix flava TaxID=2957203 RepID=UPI003D7C25D8|nr:ABC transporter substrate-binding protein [Acidimicrobiia bacterium EGI L10123]
MTNTTSTRGWLRALALVLGLAMVAAACGGGDETTSTDTDTGDGATGTGGVEDSVPDAPEGDPTPGGELTYALEAETNGGFCLAEAQLAISGMQVAATIYDTLTKPDADGQIQPHLAESVEPNEDFTSWTITLPEGVTFHDGTPLDAQVVANNIDAYRGAYENRSPLLFRFVFQDVGSVQVVDPLTVQVDMTRPWSSFDWALYGSNRIGIMGQAQLDSDDCGNELVGTGPFQLESWTVSEELVTVKNADYWRTDADGTQLPYLDRITYQPIPEVASRVNALESGQVDVIHTSDTEQIAQRLQPLAEGDQIELLATDDYSEVNYLMLNTDAAPFDNKDARLALAHALDRQLLIDVRGSGLGSVANGPFPEDVPGHVADPGFPQYDLAKAQEHAAAYEEATGEQLSFSYTFVSTESGQLTAQEIQTQLADAGIDISLSPAGDQATTINKALAGDFQAMAFRNHPGTDPDRENNWWYTGSPVNFGRIADPEMDRLLDEGRETGPGEARDAIFQDLTRRFAEEVYNVWLSTAVWAIATQSDVHNVLGYGPEAGSDAFPGVATGHDVAGIWVSR